MTNSIDMQMAAATSAEGFIDETEVLRRLPISRRTLFALRKAGKIPYVKLARRVVYHWGSVQEALLRLQRGGEQ